MKETLRCDFCSKTNECNPTLIFYRGLLSGLICGDCIVIILKIEIEKLIDKHFDRLKGE